MLPPIVQSNIPMFAAKTAAVEWNGGTVTYRNPIGKAVWAPGVSQRRPALRYGSKYHENAIRTGVDEPTVLEPRDHPG